MATSDAANQRKKAVLAAVLEVIKKGPGGITGKEILKYVRETHPELLEGLSSRQIPVTVFQVLPRLRKAGEIEIVNGLWYLAEEAPKKLSQHPKRQPRVTPSISVTNPHRVTAKLLPQSRVEIEGGILTIEKPEEATIIP